MPMAVPRPITLDDVTYIFEPGRKCNSDMGRRCCGAGPRRQWWQHAHDWHNIGTYYVDIAVPVTVRIRICDCPHCAHPPLDLDDFRNAFMEEPEVARELQFRRRLKVERHEAHDLRLRTDAALAACLGVDTADLKPWMLRDLMTDARRPR